MKRARHLLILVAAGILVLSIAIVFIVRNPNKKTAADSWICAPPEPIEWSKWVTLPKDRVISLSSDGQRVATSLLEAQTLVKLSAEQLRMLNLSPPTPEQERLLPYLVRAVRSDHARGAIEVMVMDGYVWVQFSALARTNLPLRHSAVVVLCEKPLRESFATVNIAE